MNEKKDNLSRIQKAIYDQWIDLEQNAHKKDVTACYTNLRKILALYKKQRPPPEKKKDEWIVHEHRKKSTPSIKELLSPEKQNEILAEIKRKAFS